MPQAAVAWSVAFVSLALLALGALWVWADKRKRKAPAQLPADWSVVPRPVFNTDERRLRRQLAEAFPNQLVLTKLQLIRFCHPDDPRELRFWYDLLSPLYVGFAICSENGRVLAAIDIDDNPDGISSNSRRRALKIKQAVLEACRVRYARCPAGQVPTVAELQAMLPDNITARPSKLTEAREHLAQTVASRRKERARHDSPREAPDFQDSFFSMDQRFDPSAPIGFDVLAPTAAAGDTEAAAPASRGGGRVPPAGTVLPVLHTEVLTR